MQDMLWSYLMDANLADNYWAEALLMATHVSNCLPSTTNPMQMPPIKLWNDGDSSLDHLRVFGCKAYVQVPQGLRSSKLAPRALEGIYLGPAQREHITTKFSL